MPLCYFSLTLSSIYTYFNTLKKKSFGKTLWKNEISQNEQFHLFFPPQCFLCNLYLKNFKRHISVVVCSFGMVSKLCIRKWLKLCYFQINEFIEEKSKTALENVL